MARRKSLRSQLYPAARDLGNVQAASGGPTSYGKRVVRRKVYRTHQWDQQAGAEGSRAVERVSRRRGARQRLVMFIRRRFRWYVQRAVLIV
jgi:hypothetical protein